MTAGFQVDFIGLALVFLAAFVGAFLAHRLRQSMIVGYIIMGVALGTVAVGLPGQVGSHIFLDVHARQLRPSLQLLSDLGLTFIMFFIGIEFSVRKLARTGRPSVIIAMVHFSLNMYAGVLIGSAFGWDAVSTFFLAAVMTMSSLGVAAKSLIELKRLDREETEYVVGSMIVEDFMTMVLLVLAMGTIATKSVPGGAPGEGLLESVKGAVVVYTLFIALALFIMPRLARHVERVRSDEVFVLLALAAILGSAALSYYYGMPFMLGAFFIGMAFSESRLSERLQLRLLSFRDAFVAVFFVAFGLRVDIAVFPIAILPMVAALVMIVVNDALLLSSLAYLIGFNARSSASLGSSLLGRSDDSILFASVGGGLTKPDGSKLLGQSEQIYPFSGGVSLVTNFLVPVMIRKSAQLARWMGSAMPRAVVFTGASINRAMRSILIHPHSAGALHERGLTVLPIAYVGCLLAALALILTQPAPFALAALGAAVVVLAVLYAPLSREVAKAVTPSAISEGSEVVVDHGGVVAFVPRVVTLLLLMPVVAIGVWTLAWWLSPFGALTVLGVVLAMGASVHKKESGTLKRRRESRAVEQSIEDQRRRMKRRYGSR